MIKTASILNGKEIADRHLERLSKEIAGLRRIGVVLSLATIQVGEAHDTKLYAKAIENLLKKLGIQHLPIIFPESIQEKELCQHLARTNANPAVTGIMVFTPLPKRLRSETILSVMDILKDVEGRHALQSSKKKVMPPTAMAAVALFEKTGCDATGKETLIIGRSDIVGRPAALLMLDKNATVTIAHSKTKNLRSHVERSDIVIVSVGKPEFIKGDWFKPGAIVIDAGENVVNGKLVGDVEFEKAKERASFISPVPGGVGPVTNVMLVRNLITLAELQRPPYGNC